MLVGCVDSRGSMRQENDENFFPHHSANFLNVDKFPCFKSSADECYRPLAPFYTSIY